MPRHEPRPGSLEPTGSHNRRIYSGPRLTSDGHYSPAVKHISDLPQPRSQRGLCPTLDPIAYREHNTNRVRPDRPMPRPADVYDRKGKRFTVVVGRTGGIRPTNSAHRRARLIEAASRTRPGDNVRVVFTR